MNPAGPVQLYVAPGKPAAVNSNVLCSQTGELLDKEGAAITGAIFLTVAGLVQLFTVTDSLYKPAAAVVILLTDGFCTTELKPFGPLH